jgi:hypothetical protein
MSMPAWTTMLAAIMLISAIDCACTQDAPKERAIAALPWQSDPVTEPVFSSRGPAPAQSDIHALLADPAVEDFIGLSEQPCDFIDLDTASRFGPLSDGRIAKDTIK